MSTTLTAEALPGVAGVLLTLTEAPAGDATITRTDVNGSRPVRLLPDQAPIGGSLTVRDYEAALAGLVTYTLEGSAGLVTATTRLDVLDRAVVSVPVRPAQRNDSGTVTDWNEVSESSSITHWVLEREDPVVIPGPLRLRAGAGVLRVDTYAQAVSLRSLLKAGDVVLLRQPTFPGMDAYATVERAEVVPVDAGADLPDWEVRLNYQEVAAPSAPLLGAADWTLGDVAESAPTLRDLALAFATLRDLAVGP